MDITNRCNLNCVYCCRGYRTESKPDPTYTQLIRAVDQVIQSRGTFVVLQGGEPFIRKDIVPLIEEMGRMKDSKEGFFYQELNKMIRACPLQDEFSYRYKLLLIEQGLPLYCATTNGMFYSDQLRNALRKAGFSVEISLDSPEEALNSRSRIGIDFELVKSNIEKFTQQLPVEISCTVTEENVNSIAGMLPFARKLRCVCVKFNPVIMIGKRTQGDRAWREQYLKALQLILDEHEKQPDTLYLKIKMIPYMLYESDMYRVVFQRIQNSRNILLEIHECSAFKKIKDVYIDAEFNVYACASMKNNPELIMGNLKTQSLWNIWHSKKKEQLESLIEPFCRENSRFGGCTAAAYTNRKRDDTNE